MASNKTDLPRRDFLKTAAAATAGLVIVKPESVRGAPANSRIRIGLIGCGGRGRFVARFVPQFTNATVVALADPFPDRIAWVQDELDKHIERLKNRGSVPGAVAIDDARCFAGLDGYKKLIDCGVDAVMIESPPYFHPEQAAAAVAAGKHVYIAKPVAVDAPGCRSIIDSDAKAKAAGLNFLVDFQTRSTEAFIEAARRVHAGAIGRPVLGHIYYVAGRLGVKQAQPGDTPDAVRLRNWVFDITLSGDIIVEQNIHVLDVANWYLDAHPLKCFGTGGREARTDVGDCWDHFLCTYWYPDDAKVDFCSGQFLKGYSDLCMRVYGSEGTVDSHYGGPVKITGDHAWDGGSTSSIYRDGAVANVKTFVSNIEAGKTVNNGASGAQSTLTSVLGRMAAYRGTVVTWDQMMQENEKLETTLKI